MLVTSLEGLLPDQADAYLENLSRETGVSLHSGVRTFIRGDYARRNFVLWSADDMLAELWTCDRLFGVGSEEIFPALAAASDGGYYFFLLLETGDVVSFHHDDLADYGHDLWEDDGPAGFTARMAEEYGLGSIDRLVQFSALIKAAGYDSLEDIPAGVLIASAGEAFGLDDAVLEEALGEKRFEFLAMKLPDEADDMIRGYLAGRELPERIKADRDMETINLSMASLTALPSEIAGLQKLRFLDLSGNPDLDRDAVWPLLKSLPRLRHLDLSGSDMEELPEALGELTSLESLALRGNPLEADDKWGMLKHLERLDLRFCDFPALLKQMRQAIQPKLPDTGILAENISPAEPAFRPLSELFAEGPLWSPGEEYEQEGRTALDALEMIRLHEFHEIPEILSRAAGLRGIMMIGGEASALPTFLRDLENLEILTLKLSDDADVEEITRALAALPKLKRLDLWTPWKALPESFGSLGIESLALNIKPKSWEQVNRVIGGMKTLRHLDLKLSWHLSSCGPLKGLTGLERMEIGNETDLPGLFAVLKQIPSLREFSCNQIFTDETDLPDDLCGCRNLAVLDLFGNPGFQKLPDTMGRLEKLKHMDIRENALPRREIDRLLEELPECDILRL